MRKKKRYLRVHYTYEMMGRVTEIYRFDSKGYALIEYECDDENRISNPSQELTIMAKNGAVNIHCPSILTIRATHDGAIIERLDGNQHINVSLTKLMEVLSSASFLMPSRNTIVNIHAVSKFTTKGIEMVNGTIVDVSGRRLEDCIEKLGEPE